jgi:RNA polymerase sigma factor (sigma-70 family)
VKASARLGRDDAALVSLCLDGDAMAWETLVERHGPLVWAVARKALLSPEDAADVFQNTWTAALEGLDSVRDPSRFPAWLGRVARHQCMRVRRGYGIARRARDRVARDAVDTNLPDEEVASLELRHGVALALEKIGERCARLLRALYYDSPRPAYAKIAERFGMRIGSIGPTRARCLKSLEERLGEVERD